MYDVTIDPALGMMTVKVSGFWNEATFMGYASETQRQAERLRSGGGFRSLLIDMSEFPLQGQVVADMHGKLLITAQNRYGIKAAVVMTSALSRLQATRVAKLTGQELFRDVEEARAALLA